MTGPSFSLLASESPTLSTNFIYFAHVIHLPLILDIFLMYVIFLTFTGEGNNFFVIPPVCKIVLLPRIGKIFDSPAAITSPCSWVSSKIFTTCLASKTSCNHRNIKSFLTMITISSSYLVCDEQLADSIITTNPLITGTHICSNYSITLLFFLGGERRNTWFIARQNSFVLSTDGSPAPAFCHLNAFSFSVRYNVIWFLHRRVFLKLPSMRIFLLKIPGDGNFLMYPLALSIYVFLLLRSRIFYKHDNFVKI